MLRDILTLGGVVLAAAIPSLILWWSNRGKTQAETQSVVVAQARGLMDQMAEFAEQRVAYYRERLDACMAEGAGKDKTIAGLRGLVAEMESELSLLRG
jgi:hypothetical protein